MTSSGSPLPRPPGPMRRWHGARPDVGGRRPRTRPTSCDDRLRWRPTCGSAKPSRGGAPARCRAGGSLGVIAWLDLDLPRAAAAFATAQRDGEATREPWLASGPQVRLAITKLWMGRIDEAEDAAAAALDSARLDGNRSTEAI